MKNLFRRLRMFLLLTLKLKLRRCGADTYIGYRVVIRPNTCSIGHHSFIGPECWLSVQNLQIGNFTMLAGRVAIIGGDHRIDVVGTPSIHTGRDVSRPVIIEDDVWIGHGAIVMQGVRIGEGAVVAAGSLVNKDVEPYSIVGGLPARLIRMRFDPSGIEKHSASLNDIRQSWVD